VLLKALPCPSSDKPTPFGSAALTTAYGTEEELGVALKEVALPRDQFFITTKVLSNVKDPQGALKSSLRKMGIEYVDLYLIHAPFDAEIEKAWQELEKLRDQGIPLPPYPAPPSRASPP